MKNIRSIISLLTFAVSLSFCHRGFAQTEMQLVTTNVTGQAVTDYLPEDTTFNSDIPTPEAFMGYPVGKWHVRHDQLAGYMRLLAEKSSRVTLIETGKTHEERPLMVLAISAPERQSQLEQIRETHIRTLTENTQPKADAPLILNMGYSIHGNEASGSNASMVVAYYLAAGNDARIDALLNQAVILLDPSFNPDGLSRFATWANMHKGVKASSSPFHREHTEYWPNGRTNHYWFDLNRDWLLLTHPESKARITQFHRWRPHVLTDFHEMGSNSTYFFQPGVRSRKNPLTPDSNVTLTEAIARFHADALDAKGQLYFTEEGFDDFYHGKGSTYPDAHGSVGILFEQASARGHVQDTINGELTFVKAIQNHVTTSLSTFDGSLANRDALVSYQAGFAQLTQKLIDKDSAAGVVVAKSKDDYRFSVFLNKLEAHQIRYQTVTSTETIDDIEFKANEAIFIPHDQPQYRLVKSLFSERTRFADNTFYDVSNWNIGLAFNLKYADASSRQARQLNPQTEASLNSSADTIEQEGETVAWAYEWHDFRAPALTQSLLEQGFSLRVAGKPFSAAHTQGIKDFAPGTIVVNQGLNKDKSMAIVAEHAKRLGVNLMPIGTGLTIKGIDLGSRNMRPVNLPKVMLLGGKSISPYEIGEIWHYFDTRVGVPVVLVDTADLGNTDLSSFTHIIAANGRYSSLNEKHQKQIDTWIRNGGTMIGQKWAMRWFVGNEWLDVTINTNKTIDELFDVTELSYRDQDDLSAKKRIAGAAFETKIDVSHPLFFGYQHNILPMFKTSNMTVEALDSPFKMPGRYTKSPLLGGYTSTELTDFVAETASVVAQRHGKGRVIGLVDNVNFRGYWYGTSRIMSNAVYFSGLID